jgi:hypothetical protein
MKVTAGSDAVDLYNSASGTWSTARLSVARYALVATSVGNVVIFAGGELSAAFSNSVDLCVDEQKIAVNLYNSASGINEASTSIAQASLPGSGSDGSHVKSDDGGDSRALSPPVDEESRALHGAVAQFYTEFAFFFFQMVISFNAGLASSAFRAVTSVYVSIARITWLNRKLPRMNRVATRVMLALCISTAPLCAKGLSVCSIIDSEWPVDLRERCLCRAYVRLRCCDVVI